MSGTDINLDTTQDPEVTEQDAVEVSGSDALTTQQIMREFNQRRVINRYEYMPSQQAMRENPLFVAILLHRAQYEALTNLLGLVLRQHDEGEYFYVETAENALNFDEQDIDATTVKITAILLLIARDAVNNNRDMVFFTKADVGVMDKTLHSIYGGEHAHMMRSLKLKDVDAVKSELVNRGFAYRKTDGLVLTKGAVTVMEGIIAQHRVGDVGSSSAAGV